MKSKAQRPESKVQGPGTTWLAHECGFCGAKGGAYLAHYGVMRCSCGNFVWALQPRRDGPLELFPHPGFHPAPSADSQFRAGARETVSPKVRVAGLLAGDHALARLGKSMVGELMVDSLEKGAA